MAINLIDNAIKYTPSEGQVSVKVCIEDGAGVLRVEDTGIGIPEENIPRLFERFYRVDKSRSRALGGTGLGLAIVKHIVNLIGGHIRVSSVVGKGSVFTVSFPLDNTTD
jgi:two-component system phosphate regulon sensor histidine kinase PhoR